ncbi:hypothetical protein PHISCL_07944 [Aspergillus sclerotialis]|uniref:Uncharacterized protein n=1 Tax=Aspergillus sclerotialis TaxID=2070753 RepID=A0A3A2Z9C0_9EURO|nr:hypothetical protein PHISCL_07944 [Aspergillus sclerotialis]
MAPAPIVLEAPQDPRIQSLSKAFEGLLLTVHQLSCREKDLQQWLKYANDEYLKLADRLPDGPDAHTQTVSKNILTAHSEYDQKQPSKLTDVVQILAESEHVDDRTLDAIAEGLECFKSIAALEDDTARSGLNPCPVTSRNEVSESMEKDFTIKGTQGSLRCPFAKPNNKPSVNGVADGIEDAFKTQKVDTCGHEDIDPIKAELNDKHSIQTPSARSSAARCPVSRCPIRFLNQHTPEEVADYVERHKHEIPRSHAVCVQRYQRSSESMRQLDSKYGSLINMIRGLSVKHQAFLPNHQQGAASNAGSAERVEKWAADLGSDSRMHAAIKEEEEDNGEERQGHFDRPLREVRVGESPSRPWGIPVPIPPDPVTPVPHSPAAPVPVSSDKKLNGDAGDGANVDALSAERFPDSLPDSGAKAGRCPFGHGAKQVDNVAPETETIRNEEDKPKVGDASERNSGDIANDVPGSKNGKSANVVFNGPVFFGYSAEQTAGLIQNLRNLGNSI